MSENNETQTPQVVAASSLGTDLDVDAVTGAPPVADTTADSPAPLTPPYYSPACIPDFITFTGVDAFTDVNELIAISKDYPVEWGVLFSPSRQGAENRYPPLNAVREMLYGEAATSQEAHHLRFAAHLCGDDAKALLDGGTSPHDDMIGRAFHRVQVNTTSKRFSYDPLATWGHELGVDVILQCRGEFPTGDESRKLKWLFDLSGGRGASPSRWPRPTHDDRSRLLGFAGGLNPDNVHQHAIDIGGWSRSYWLDMETGVRDENDRFSLEKCRAVLMAVYGPMVDREPVTPEVEVVDATTEEYETDELGDPVTYRAIAGTPPVYDNTTVTTTVNSVTGQVYTTSNVASDRSS
jgi:hypothetical protein